MEETTVETTTEAAPALDDREAQLVIRENTLTAKEAFGKHGIPEDLIAFVVDADSTKQDEKITTLQKAWANALKKAVESKLKSQAPALPTRVMSGEWKDLSYSQKMALKKSDPELYDSLLQKARQG
jgi:hypothetical protein